MMSAKIFRAVEAATPARTCLPMNLNLAQLELLLSLLITALISTLL
jgi:hypothetical protein